MIISTKKGTPKEELEKIVDRFEKQGLDVTLTKIVINMIVYLYLNTPRGSCQIIINGFIKI